MRRTNADRTCVNHGECRPPHRSTKNTREWCKGREGIPHIWEWRVWYPQLSHHWNRVTEEQICFGCAKIGRGRRSYCRQCGEPWPDHPVGSYLSSQSCARCAAPWRAVRVVEEAR